MSSFTAIIGLRRYLRDHPGTPIEEVVLSLRRSDADFTGADFEGAVLLHNRLPEAIDFAEPQACIRQSLAVLITTYSPWWCRFFPYGRQRLAMALTPDELQTFRSAGLFEEQPSQEIVEWWDGLADQIRFADAERRNAQGRRAEILSLKHERTRLKSCGISDAPKWTAIEDNSAGYDIQSYMQTSYGLKNLLIEVKSSQRNPPRIVLTRGEWVTAEKYGSAYLFHVWKIPSEELLIKTVSEIAQHISTDHGNGRWSEIEIEL